MLLAAVIGSGMIYRQSIAVILILLLTVGCSQQGINVRHLAKSDISHVADVSYRQSHGLLRELAAKLYKRNPVQLARGQGGSREQRLAALFDESGPLRFRELEGHYGISAMEMAFAPEYAGDRVFALMAGLVDMIRQSYGYIDDFYLYHSLDGQKLHNSARNIEIMAWRLSNRRGSDGNLLLLTHSLPGEPANHSYERLYGKLIALQDIMADLMARKGDRVVNKIAVNAASFAFLPL